MHLGDRLDTVQLLSDAPTCKVLPNIEGKKIANSLKLLTTVQTSHWPQVK